MNRLDLKDLQARRLYPSVSIVAPTHRSAPLNQADPIRIRNLVDHAVDRVRAEQAARESAALESNLSAAVSSIEWSHTLDGVAIFANAEVWRVYNLPFAVEERTVVDETFATRDLVRLVNRAQRYWVLALSESPTRLYEADAERLTEVKLAGFPFVHEPNALPSGPGTNPSAMRDEYHRQFFRRVDAALSEILREDARPVVLVGVQRYHSFYAEVSANTGRLVAHVEGSHDSTPLAKLHGLVQPAFERWQHEIRQGALATLRDAIGQRRAADTLDDLWRAAKEGRVQRLFVEDTFAIPARVTNDGLSIEVAQDREAPDVVDDIIDEIIEQVMLTGGDVTFVDDGSLSDFQRAGAILRY